MKPTPHSDWKTPYMRSPRIDFGADTRQGRRARVLRLWAIRIFCFALAILLLLFALGWGMGVAPTMQ